MMELSPEQEERLAWLKQHEAGLIDHIKANQKKIDKIDRIIYGKIEQLRRKKLNLREYIETHKRWVKEFRAEIGTLTFPPPNNIELKDRNESIFKDRINGMKLAEIGKKHDISGSRVKDICAKFGRKISWVLARGKIDTSGIEIAQDYAACDNIWIVHELNPETCREDLYLESDDQKHRVTIYGEPWRRP
jgi:hypothetical protein